MLHKSLFATTALACTLSVLGPQIAHADVSAPLDIPAQPLAQAITQLGRETGLTIAAESAAVAGKRSTAVQGPMTPNQALARLLEGTGLSAERIGVDSALVSRNLVAQNALDEDPMELGTLVLQGELITRTLAESQTSAAVESGEILNERGDPDLYAVIERTPNVSAFGGEKGFAIRGVDQNGQGGTLNGLLVTTQIDGVALPTAPTTFFGPYSTWDVDQVEILRGPQSTQQGRNALAGAVIINTNDPEYFQEFKLRAGASSRNGYELKFMGNTPLIDDRLALRFTAELSGEDGWVTSRPLDDDRYDARSYESYRGKLRWTPTDRFEAILSYSYTDSEGGEDYVIADEFPSKRVSDQNAEAVEGVTHKSLALDTSFEINPSMTLTTQTNIYSADYLRVEGTVAPLTVNLVTADASYDTFEQDVRLAFESGIASGVVGIFYTEIDGGAPFGFQVDLGTFDPRLAGLVETRTNEFFTEVQNAAIYGEVDLDASGWVPGLTFTIGGRYDYEKFSFSQQTTYELGVLPPPFVDIPRTNGSYTFDAFLPKIGLRYELSTDQTVGFTIQRGYRSGGYGVNIGAGRGFEYDPEYTTNYELSYRGAFRGDTLRVAANMYYTRWTDQQVAVSTGVTGPAAQFDSETVNAAESELYGLELLIEGEATDQISYFASLGIAETKFLDFEGNTGNRFPSAPRDTLAIGGSYLFDNGLKLAADVAYTGGSFQDVENTFTDDERWVVNAQATQAFDNGLIAGLYVRNLFDEDYTTSVNANGLLARTGEPRTIGAYLEMTF